MLTRFGFKVAVIGLLYNSSCAESSFSGGSNKAKPAPVPQATPAPQQAAAQPKPTPTPTPEPTPEPCVEKIIFTEFVYIDGKVQEYQMIGRGNGSNPSAVPNVKMSTGNIVTITAPQGGTMYYTWTSGPAAPAACPIGIIASEVKSGSGAVVQDAASDVYTNGITVKENDTVLYLGYRDTWNYYHDNSGGCSLQVEVKDKKCS